jgi:hypothetical protein
MSQGLKLLSLLQERLKPHGKIYIREINCRRKPKMLNILYCVLHKKRFIEIDNPSFPQKFGIYNNLLTPNTFTSKNYIQMGSSEIILTSID